MSGWGTDTIGCRGVMTTVSMRVNLSMAVVCMVNSTAFATKTDPNLNQTQFGQGDNCPNTYLTQDSAMKSGYNGDLLWSPSMQSLLFSSTFYGGIVTIGFSGYMADRFGPKLILLVAAMVYVVVTLLTPLLARWSYAAYFISRLIMGLGEGFVFPTLASIVSRWFAPSERSTVAALYTSGNQIAAGLTSLISANLCDTRLGWPSIFYLTGSMGIVWCIVWYFMASNHPSSNRWMSVREKEFLAANVMRTKGEGGRKVPWRSLATSLPLLVAVACQFGYNLQAGILQAFLPTYLKDVLRLPLHSNGIYTTIPFLTQLISKNILAILADYLKRNHILEHTKCAKLFQIVGSIGSSALLLALAFIPNCQVPQTALPILALYGIFFSAGICGFFTSILSIAPAHSGTLGSISMIFGMLGNMAGPITLSILSSIMEDNKWTLLFIVCSVVNIAGGILFAFFGSADVQPWARSTSRAQIFNEFGSSKSMK